MAVFLFWSLFFNVTFSVAIAILFRAWRAEFRRRIDLGRLARKFGGIVKRMHGWTNSEYEACRKDFIRPARQI